MKDNWNVRVEGAKVVLVPYRAAHVPTYHLWMQVLSIYLHFGV